MLAIYGTVWIRVVQYVQEQYMLFDGQFVVVTLPYDFLCLQQIRPDSLVFGFNLGRGA